MAKPDLYELLGRANAAERLSFRRAPRRRYPVLSVIAWFAESGARMALLIAAALVVGGVLGWVLP